jgi:hypothetical protein
MEKKRALIENPITFRGRTLIPISQVSTWTWQSRGQTSFFGFKKPLFILISAPETNIRAIKATGELVSWEALVSALPALKEDLAKLRSFP